MTLRLLDVRLILIVDGYAALLRARRWRRRWEEDTRRQYERHRWRVEGVHGEAKPQHGLRRAVRRALANVAIQAYLTAAVINLKRLAALVLGHFYMRTSLHAPTDASRALRAVVKWLLGTSSATHYLQTSAA